MYCECLTILNLALWSVRVETAKVTTAQEASDKYVLMTALACCSSLVAMAELKLGQYSHKKTVPKPDEHGCKQETLDI